MIASLILLWVLHEAAWQRGLLSPFMPCLGLFLFWSFGVALAFAAPEVVAETSVIFLEVLVAGAAFLVTLAIIHLHPERDPSLAPRTTRVPFGGLGLAFAVLTLVAAAPAVWPWLRLAGIRAGESANEVMEAAAPGSAVFTYFFGYASWGCVRLARRKHLRFYDPEADDRAPVLYLRSFGLGREPKVRRFEEGLNTGLFERVGPFVGLGDPLDYLPTPGALKLYSTNRDWQQRVIALVERARVVILLEGDSFGLEWELSALRSTGASRLFAITPPPRVRRDHNAWNRFCWLARDVGFECPDDDPGAGSVLELRPNGKVDVLASGLRKGEEFADAIVQRMATHAAH